MLVYLLLLYQVGREKTIEDTDVTVNVSKCIFKRYRYSMEQTISPVILTGTLSADPRAFLTRKRTLGCMLKVQRRTMLSIMASSPVPEYDSYTIHVFGPLRDILFACAVKSCPVAVCGMFSRTGSIINAEHVYCTNTNLI
jgi:hypothetical protein